MRDDLRRTLVAYDIPHDRRRTKAAQTLLTYGDRVQYSVFIVDCIPAQLLRLKEQLREIINTDEDSVLFCDIGLVATLQKTNYSYLGLEPKLTSDGPLIF
ncbi:CRISPR-associated endonuclease Cas2 [Corynebacterium cystitidis]|uniref:CRISPR-associated endoribonuclease Cas2 n=1 Tax=Corynebacterium cystitidis DSM 20524 TaxID=1121357 RepID=A0A1H9UM85_9CORY|nr:CRISPR-associated endonuclease Cas2 [Corynebacterium cystitidis]WJY81022.1 CRISPR-associated endoribonuclease Cas2 [Corynebacterium cystitidis DSM 20524]SES10247.1 CRISPR-associated protein Cas2 [Corynebacterium cystitidis DSM 20524]SNV90624.1 putative CRISPR-associated protein [Corynebacterium cystitidis]